MLVPQVSGVFDVYNCSKNALKQCVTPVLDKSAQQLTWQSWLLSVGLAAGVWVVHLLGRLVKCPKEFKVSQKRIDKDMEMLRKREEKKATKECGKKVLEREMLTRKFS